MRAEGLPTNVACRVLGVSESGFYAWRSRPPSARSVRHAWLTDIIHHVHHGSRGIYGALRVHAELRLGHGITVGHNAVAMLMRKAGLVVCRGFDWVVECGSSSSDFGDDFLCGSVPDEGFGVLVPVVGPDVDRFYELSDAGETVPAYSFLG